MRLANAGGGRVDRCERCRLHATSGAAGFSRLQHAVLRMKDLEAVGATPYLAEAMHTGTGLQAVLLRGTEVEEAQRQGAGTVLHARDEAAPPAEDDIRQTHLALYRDFTAFLQAGNGGDTCAVLVA